MWTKARTESAALAALLVGLVWAVPPGARADGIDDFNASWAGRSLSAQRLLDVAAPIADANIIGTHNSFNSGVYSTPTSYLDPNQVDSIYNQLRMGARTIELDVHWTAKSEGPLSFPDRLLLCHGDGNHLGCSLTDRYFAEGLDEIAAWLGSGASTDQVLILHIEDHMEGQHGEAYQQMDSRFGDRIYRSGGCGDIPGALTKAEVLAAGTNVVVWNEGGCSGDGNWNSTVYTGLGALSRVWEDSTVIGGIGGAGASIGDADVINYFGSGTNIIDLDQLHQNDSRWVAAIWSWDVDEPNNLGNEDCAAQLGNGHWNDADCANPFVFACRNLFTGGWAIGAAGAWGVGTLACDSLGSSYRFGLPANSLDNQALKLAKEAAGQSQVWLNHDDRWAEGDWTTSSGDTVFYAAGSLSLWPGQSVSGSTRRLKMGFNCELVLESVSGGVIGGVLWTSGTAGAGSNCMADFQPDGNLVVYEGGGQSVWASGTSGTSGAELHLQADGNAVLYNDTGVALWASFTDYAASLHFAAGQFGLLSGQIQHSASRKLVMQVDCDLVLYSFENGVTGGVLWRSNTSGAGTNCELDFQSDGNLVVYDGGGQPLWAAGTSGTQGGELRLQSDGNLVVYNGAGQPLWGANANTPSQHLSEAGQLTLSSGQFLQTQSRELEMGADCDLTLSSVANYLVGGLLWHSDTAGAGTDCYVDFQADGNLVLYDGADQTLWASGTSGTADAKLRLQEDGNLVVYNGAGQPLWASQTIVPAQLVFDAGQFGLLSGQFVRTEIRDLTLQSDCNLVLYNVTNALVGAPLWDSDTLGAGSDCELDFQLDGNLVVYDGAGQPRWASGTSGTSGAQLWLQSDGNMVIYNGEGAPLWSSSTQGIFISTGVCGDAACEGETCSSCSQDCGVCAPICGDFSCGGVESCSNCPGDCGACPPPKPKKRCGVGSELAVLIPLLLGARRMTAANRVSRG